MYKPILASLCLSAVVYSSSAQSAATDAPAILPAADDSALHAAPDQARTIKRLLAASGADDMIDQLSDLAAAGFEQQPPQQLQHEDYETFKAAFLETFDGAKIRDIVVEYLNTHYDAQIYNEALALLNTPLAKKMTALEIQAMTPESQQEMMKSARATVRQATPARLALVQRLDEAQQATETMVDMQTMMAKTMIEHMNELVRPEQRMPTQALEEMMAQMRLEASGFARQYVQLQMIYAYRTVTDQELEDYVELHEAESGRHTTELLDNAWMTVFERLSAELGDQLGHHIADEPPKTVH